MSDVTPAPRLDRATLDALREQYTDVPVPPCRVCGGPLTIQASGGGVRTTYAHTVPDGVQAFDWVEHYRASTWSPRYDGDSRVIKLLDAYATEHPDTPTPADGWEAVPGYPLTVTPSTSGRRVVLSGAIRRDPQTIERAARAAFIASMKDPEQGARTWDAGLSPSADLSRTFWRTVVAPALDAADVPPAPQPPTGRRAGGASCGASVCTSDDVLGPHQHVDGVTVLAAPADAPGVDREALIERAAAAGLDVMEPDDDLGWSARAIGALHRLTVTENENRTGWVVGVASPLGAANLTAAQAEVIARMILVARPATPAPVDGGTAVPSRANVHNREFCDGWGEHAACCGCQDCAATAHMSYCRHHTCADAPVDGDAVERAARAWHEAAEEECGGYLTGAWDAIEDEQRDRARRFMASALAAARADAPTVTGEPVGQTPRGFPIWASFADECGQQVTVVTSSLATDHCLWVQPHDAKNVHLTIENAHTLRDAITAWLGSVESGAARG